MRFAAVGKKDTFLPIVEDPNCGISLLDFIQGVNKVPLFSDNPQTIEPFILNEPCIFRMIILYKSLKIILVAENF